MTFDVNDLKIKVLTRLKVFANVNALFEKKFRACALLLLLVLLVGAGLFAGKQVMQTEVVSTRVTTSGSNALMFDVTNVNSVIARQFNVPTVAGVLVNDVPTGSARKLVDVKRGDILLKFNNISIQSAHHLRHLMSQRSAGDTLSFVILRNGKLVEASVKIPAFSGIMNVYSLTPLSAACVLAILIATFVALFLNLFDRTVCIVLGAIAMLVAGAILGFYNQAKAFQAIQMSPILIFVGMSIFTIFLEKFRCCEYVAKKIIIETKGDVYRVVGGLCLIAYVFSLFLNNLSTILILIPITLYVCKSVNMDPVPVIIGEVIASNVGGASTLIGDFPNMLISSSTGLHFIDFLCFMFPICVVLLAVLLWYIKRFEFSRKNKGKSGISKKMFLKSLAEDIEKMDIDWRSVKDVCVVLGAVILGFIVLPIFKIQSATIALGGGFVLLAWKKKHAKEVLRKINFSNVIFFIGLFIIVGGAVHGGLLTVIADAIAAASFGSQLVYLIIIMWVAAFSTAFLNAGPSTAFFIPIIMHSDFVGFNDIAWWALSLGVLAGSSATITGATAGIVTQALLDDHSEASTDPGKSAELTFRAFSERGIPLAFIFLGISTLYIMLLFAMPGVRGA